MDYALPWAMNNANSLKLGIKTIKMASVPALALLSAAEIVALIRASK